MKVRWGESVDVIRRRMRPHGGAEGRVPKGPESRTARAVPFGWDAFLRNLAAVVGRVKLDGLARMLFEGANQAHLATLLPDGSPYSVPLWVGIEEEHLAFLTAPNSREARNVDRDPRVAIWVTDRDQPFTMAHIRGRVVQRIEGNDAWAVIDRLSRKYVGGPYPRDRERVVFLVRPEHIHSNAYA
jgi:PPOX class probable F420-dependent enzyme